MGTNVPTASEALKEVKRIAKPDDAAGTQAQLTYTSLRNILSSQRLTSPDIADAPLDRKTLLHIQGILESSRSNSALQIREALDYLAGLNIPEPPPNVLQRIVHSAGSSLQKVTRLLSHSPRAEGATSNATIPQVKIDM